MSDRQDDKDGAALQDRAQALIQIERYEEALLVLARARPIAPDPAWVLAATALCHRNLGHNAEALRFADQCLAVDPSSYSGHFARAHALLGLRRFAQAEAAARDAVVASSDACEAWDVLITALYRLRRYGEAYEAATKLAEVAPERGEPHHWLGLFAGMEQQWTEAERHYRKALELEPNWHNTLSNLATVVARLGRRQECLELNVRAIQMAPAKAEAPLRNLINEVEVSISSRWGCRLWAVAGVLTSILFATGWAPSEHRAPYFVVAGLLALAGAILLSVRLAAVPPIVRRYYWQWRRSNWHVTALELGLTMLSFVAAWTFAGALNRLVTAGPSAARIAAAVAGAAVAAPYARWLWRHATVQVSFEP